VRRRRSHTALSLRPALAPALRRRQAEFEDICREAQLPHKLAALEGVCAQKGLIGGLATCAPRRRAARCALSRCCDSLAAPATRLLPPAAARRPAVRCRTRRAACLNSARRRRCNAHARRLEEAPLAPAAVALSARVAAKAAEREQLRRALERASAEREQAAMALELRRRQAGAARDGLGAVVQSVGEVCAAGGAWTSRDGPVSPS